MSGERPKPSPYRLCSADWEAYQLFGMSLDILLEEAIRWAGRFRGIERPWLCWNVDSNWCVVQQRLVKEVGWTPVVGFDPRAGEPQLVPGAVLMNFNERLRLPSIGMHFPMEFIVRYAECMAYGHADLLLRHDQMRRYADLFASLQDGEMAAVRPEVPWREIFKTKDRRYREVPGCSTRGASRSQFENGCGWWMSFSCHPSLDPREAERREAYRYECGTGIRFWARTCGGEVRESPESEIRAGHFMLIGRKDYIRASAVNFKRDLSKEWSLNNDLVAACRKLDIEDMVLQDAQHTP